MMKRRVRLKISSASRQTVKFVGGNQTGRCPSCGGEVEIVAGDEVARILQVNDLILGRFVGADGFHRIKTVGDAQIVSQASPFTVFEGEPRDDEF